MKIAVCLKLVPSTTADIRPAADGKSLQLAGVETVVNPYDEYALEAALKLRETFPGSTIMALTAGGDDATKVVLHAFSLGVDAVTQIKAPNVSARGAALAIASALKEIAPDIVLCGRQAIDDDQWEFPGALGELLNAPHVTAVFSLTVSPDAKKIVCKRRFNRDDQTLEAELPAVVTCDKGLNDPRAATLKGRLDAKKKQPAVKTPADLGLDEAALIPALRVEKYSPPPQKAPGKSISLPPAEAARELVNWLRNEAKVI
ncbi:MAG TPA: electron transfer flavoprotein subunit beta/FixA family protein [Planctomycetota bacterium]|nr:electron transfer flavoprotein subunit beta/FixA family protein [Planctomycetota bacterium]